MVTEIQYVILLLASIFGALSQSILGWKDTGGSFDFSRYAPSLVRAGIAGVATFTATYTGFIGDVNIFTYIMAFFGGMGVDASGNRLAGIITTARATEN